MHAKEMSQGTHPNLQRVINTAAKTPAKSAGSLAKCPIIIN